MEKPYSREDLDSFLKIAVRLAKEGGDVLRHYWGNLRSIQSKEGSGNIVTEADKASEEVILQILGDTVPTHGVLAEESGAHEHRGTPYLWVIDPLDGTTNYAHMLPMVSVSIALLYSGVPIVGVVYNPILDDLFTATIGNGSYLNGNRLQVSRVKDLEHSLLATGFGYDRRTVKDNNYAEFIHFTNLTQGVRRLGSAALDLAYVASGVFDGYWERGIQPWDVAAGALLVSEAGGQVTAYEGTSVDLFSGRILATNGHLHKDMIDTLKTQLAPINHA